MSSGRSRRRDRDYSPESRRRHSRQQIDRPHRPQRNDRFEHPHSRFEDRRRYRSRKDRDSGRYKGSPEPEHCRREYDDFGRRQKRRRSPETESRHTEEHMCASKASSSSRLKRRRKSRFSSAKVLSSASASSLRESTVTQSCTQMPEETTSVRRESMDVKVEYGGDCAFLESKYTILNRIHAGTYGKVYRVRHNESGEERALKVLRISETTSKSGFPQSALREVRILQTLSQWQRTSTFPLTLSTKSTSTQPMADGICEGSLNVVRLFEVALMETRVDRIALVLEFCEQDLYALLKAYATLREAFNSSEVKCLMRQLLAGVRHLHSLCVVHRDLKTSNLLLTHSGTLKICDFGVSRFCHCAEDCEDFEDAIESELRRMTPQCMTLWYRPPEMLLDATDYGTAVDMWSVACVFYELLTTGQHLFTGNNEIEMLNAVLNTVGKPDADEWPQFACLLAKSSASRQKGLSFVGRKKKRKQWFADFTGIRTDSIFSVGAKVQLSATGIDLMESLLRLDPKRRLDAGSALTHAWFLEAPVAIDKALLPTHPAINKEERSTALHKVKQRRDQIHKLGGLFA